MHECHAYHVLKKLRPLCITQGSLYYDSSIVKCKKGSECDLFAICRSNNHRGQPPSGSPPGLFEW